MIHLNAVLIRTIMVNIFFKIFFCCYVCREDSDMLVYPLVLLLPGDVHHLIHEVSEAVFQNLHVVFGLVSFGVNRVLSHLNVQM